MSAPREKLLLVPLEAATGGWGFAHFQDGKPADEAFMKPCFPCHNQAKASDLVFTRYVP